MSYETRVIMNYQFNTCDIIGRGFSSIVYKGINTITKENVAIKVIKRQFSDQLPLIQNEIQILSKLQGRNILKLYEHFTTQNNIYIITEYCRQGDLGQKLKQFGYLRQEYAVAIIRQIIDGIYVMAQQNIIHRDLKPQNILINEDGIKIADFGFAKPLNQLQNEMNVGTPLYMSPETIIKSQYNAKSDIWSLGVLFYEVLFGYPPWQAQTEQELIFKILNQRISFPDVPPVSETVKDFIKQCLIVDPYLRLGITELLKHPLIKRTTKKAEKFVRPTDTESTEQTIKSEIPNSSEPWTSNSSNKKLVYVNCKNPQVNAILNKYLNTKNNQVTNNNTVTKNQPLLDEISLILQSQFSLCIFLNNIISKLKDFKLITPLLNEKCRIIFSKHLQSIKDTIYKQLIESDNKFKFKDWQLFCKENAYSRFSAKFLLENNQFTKTCQEYNQMIKSNKSLIIEYQKYDSEFYQILFGLEWKVIKKIIKNLIIEFNHIIAQNIDTSNLCNKINKSQQIEISFLQQLYYYYEIVDKYYLKEFDEKKFAQESNIQQYMVVKELKISDYLESRQLIKRLMKS
ncbi:unnamed protein product (macronuclear) [Paramecium tetraurelia]|uniref:Protein kinase domain-containing protein n=1 Tax=Paramecium tetraurelia TaxID=5888 RepID=A0C7U8_PARTE|nr:uncharacterized protein GSPATT00035996001 [Paramecium tetraurelia]CAK66865.1 unnamed protein product [Paramecium tetraurelia]|eukprot:XP_001434262.1 hypothetical protein (macronuclear) [Paramecium tetraurelia strain d4-2]